MAEQWFDADSVEIDTTAAVRELVGIVLAEQSFEEVLGRVVDVSKRSLDGAFEVSVTMEGRIPLTAATTSPAFTTPPDEAQYDAGYGPCLDALRLGETVIVTDQSTEDRWPAYSPRAIAAGVGSSVSVPLLIEDRHVAALNIYGARPYAFTADDIATAEDIADHAAVVLANADLYFSAESRADQMAEAMQSRAVIEQAKGILMGGRRCDADAAFAILVRLSQSSGRKLHDVAQALVDQASTPVAAGNGGSPAAGHSAH
jgi:GAF domain-containing protein